MAPDAALHWAMRFVRCFAFALLCGISLGGRRDELSDSDEPVANAAASSSSGLAQKASNRHLALSDSSDGDADATGGGIYKSNY